jgi:hypothetical protein
MSRQSTGESRHCLGVRASSCSCIAGLHHNRAIEGVQADLVEHALETRGHFGVYRSQAVGDGLRLRVELLAWR